MLGFYLYRFLLVFVVFHVFFLVISSGVAGLNLVS